MNLNNDNFNMATVDRFFRTDYQDRGMMKWQGFYLSDHNAALEKRNHSSFHSPKILSQQPRGFIKSAINEASRTQRRVTIQLNSISANSNDQSELTTHIHGYNENEVMVDGKHFISLMAIRNLHF